MPAPEPREGHRPCTSVRLQSAAEMRPPLRTMSPKRPGTLAAQTMYGDAPTVGCLFSGMGGFASGMVAAGFQVAWATDDNRAACATFRHRLPKVRVVEKDVRDVTVEQDQLKPVDVLTAGFPCQSFSQAGDRKGFDDGRGEVFFHIPRLLKEFGPTNRPKVVVLENVDYIMYGNDHWWFDQIQRELRGAGYWFRRESCWRVNVKDVTDVPQDRRRVFMLAASRHFFRRNPFTTAPADNPSLRNLHDIVDRTTRSPDADYLPSDNRYCKMIANGMAQGSSQHSLYQLRRSYVREKSSGLCPTLTANMGTGGHNVPFIKDEWGIRRLRIDEVAQLQGFDAEALFPELPDNEKYRLLGNAVCPKLARVVGERCLDEVHREVVAWKE